MKKALLFVLLVAVAACAGKTKKTSQVYEPVDTARYHQLVTEFTGYVNNPVVGSFEHATVILSKGSYNEVTGYQRIFVNDDRSVKVYYYRVNCNDFTIQYGSDHEADWMYIKNAVDAFTVLNTCSN